MKIWIFLILVIGTLIYFNNLDDFVYDKDEIVVPVSIHLVDDGTVQYRSDRDLGDLNRIFLEVNRIWGVGQIRFVVSSVDVVKISNEDFGSALGGDLDKLTQRDDFKEGINGYFARYISSNGMAFPAQGFFIIGDITSVNDYRATSHELGHLVGLKHVSDRNYLMFSGSNGELLSQGEIDIARRNARRVFEIEV